MLPFLKPKQAGGIASVIIKNRTPDKDSNSKDLDKSVEDCAQDLISAIQASDKSKVVEAIRNLIKNIDEPKESVEPHSYQAQNIAAKE